MKITTKDELAKIKDGEIVELPEFSEGQPFIARLRRPSLLYLCKSGVIPNELLGLAQKMYEGKAETVKLGEYYDVVKVILETAMVEPKFEDVEGILTDEQIICIYNYTQLGVRALKPFRDLKSILKNTNAGKNSK
jgi:hypothetical protein